MEIVKQRKKRLTGWLLVMALCGLLWHNSAAAAEVTQTNLDYWDNFLDTVDRTYTAGVTYDPANGSLSIPATASSFEASAVTEGYSHTLLSWTLEGPDGSTQGQGGPILPESGKSWSDYTDLYLQWGKILVLTDLSGNEIGVCTQSDSVNPGQITLPATTDGIPVVYNGKFFSEWRSGKSGYSIANNNALTVDFSYLDTFTRISVSDFTVYDSNTVPGNGTYNLPDTDTYILGASGEIWSVGNDGYDYSGGITFAGPGKEYTYNRK